MTGFADAHNSLENGYTIRRKAWAPGMCLKMYHEDGEKVVRYDIGGPLVAAEVINFFDLQATDWEVY